MIIARKFMPEDIKGIDDIFKKQHEFGVPSLSNLIINGTLIDDNTGRLVGYGAVKIFTEMVLILDKDLSKKEKAQAVREAMKSAIVMSKDAGVETLYAIANTDKFSKVLRKSYGAKGVPGELLMIDLIGEEDNGKQEPEKDK